jgi:hypothetical protein
MSDTKVSDTKERLLKIIGELDLRAYGVSTGDKYDITKHYNEKEFLRVCEVIKAFFLKKISRKGYSSYSLKHTIERLMGTTNYVSNSTVILAFVYLGFGYKRYRDKSNPNLNIICEKNFTEKYLENLVSYRRAEASVVGQPGETEPDPELQAKLQENLETPGQPEPDPELQAKLQENLETPGQPEPDPELQAKLQEILETPAPPPPPKGKSAFVLNRAVLDNLSRPKVENTPRFKIIATTR